MKNIAVRTIPRAEPADIDALEALGVATVHEAQGQLGLLKHYIRPIFTGCRIAGSAVTVLAPPGDNWMLHVALELCQPGDILVVAVTKDNTDAMFGDLLGTSAKSRGVKGLVVDAGVRDVSDLTAMKFPVWARAISAKGPVKKTLGSVNLPIVCAGMLVTPGDVIVADDDGVCVVPRKMAQGIVKKGQQREADEAEKRARLKAGELGLDVFDMRPGLEEAGFAYFDTSDDVPK